MKTFLAALTLLLASPLTGGEISGFVEPSEVNSLVMRAMSDWSLKPADETGCNSGDCCPSATDIQCSEFAKKVIQNPAGWSHIVAAQLPLDGDWTCTSWPRQEGSNERQTACTAVSGTPIIDVSRILSELAAQIEE
jgi:hypothetical protein